MNYPRYSISGKGSVYLSGDPGKRVEKAKKILMVLSEVINPEECAALDIGTGYGIVASELSKFFKSVTSIDIADERLQKDGFDFKVYGGTQIPFADASFDVVIANHVIEHVPDQHMTLNEICRVLKPGGVCYVAVPNRWALIEPHFGVPLLAWFPQKFASAILKLLGKGDFFDVRSYGAKGYQKLLSGKFMVQDITMEIVQKWGVFTGSSGFPASVIKYIPEPLLGLMLVFSPTYIFILRRAGGQR